ncbi:heptaprenylglyceryl phosphate synthase [Cohnella massiliensis]|uniref:heptaprenylglyceryl phosphate synthase n=1 Tax=Cohnella massiliensis TaxID=1816691 RepID=UPI0009BB42B9|nr:heptaprenylglyceryl phosphate synthase [Cohnella massiliensis]
MNSPFYSEWRHVFKLDPDRPIDDDRLAAVCASGTDAILVGGSSGLTFDNTVDLLSRVRRFETPCALELSDPECGVPGFDGYFIPMMLNTDRGEWIARRQAEALRDYGRLLPWEHVAGEAYLVLNPDSTAAKVTGAKADLSAAEIAAYAQVADRLWRAPVVYLEYSGTFGDMATVRSVRGQLTQARLFYGGGIRSAEQARQAALSAHTVVVGNVVYEDLEAALSTVDAVINSAKEQDHVF